MDTTLVRKNKASFYSRRFAKKEQKGFLSAFVTWSWVIFGIAAIFQMLFFTTLANFCGVTCGAISWLLVTSIFLKEDSLKKFPLSSFLVVSFVLTQLYFPAIFTIIEGKAVVNNLVLPFQVFFHSILQLLFLLLAHYLYRSLMRGKLLRKKSVLAKAGFFTPPSEMQVWIMGFVGITCMFYIYFYAPSNGADVTTPFAKFVQGFQYFAYAPFFISLHTLYVDKSTLPKKLVAKLSAFTLLLFIVSLGRNSRGAFMIGFLAIALAFFLGILLDYYRPKFFTVKNVIFALIGVWLFTGPISDLATAMVIVRNQRATTNRSALVGLTIKAFQDKKAIQQYRLESTKTTSSWDEYYLDNVLLSRLCNIKYIDLSLIQANKIGKIDPEMREFTINRLLSTFPSPLLKVLGVRLDKQSTTSASFGDYLYYRAGAGTIVLGGFRTGNMAGVGMASFGWFYLLILGVIMIPVFYLFDKLVIHVPVYDNSSNKLSSYKLRFSFCSLLLIYTVYSFLPLESITIAVGYIIRGWLQTIVLYFLIYRFTSFLKNYLSKDNSSKRRVFKSVRS